MCIKGPVISITITYEKKYDTHMQFSIIHFNYNIFMILKVYSSNEV